MIFFKTEYIRSNAILYSAKDEPCVYCGAQDGTIVAAHSDRMLDGKSKNNKAHDIFVAFLCYDCHNRYGVDHTISQEEFNECIKRTWEVLWHKGVIGVLK